MDQIKIGKYIASKRKELGLTQAQLAEKLGMSDKSVSKWERGVCLPDVSVYSELCAELGISINEFFAGEDIEESNVAAKSEENIISIVKDALVKSKKLKRIIALLAVVAIIFAGAFAWAITRDKAAPRNYVKLLSADNVEVQTARTIALDSATFLYECEFKEDVSEISIIKKTYEYGQLTDSGEILKTLNGDGVKDGRIALVENERLNDFTAAIAAEEFKISSSFEFMPEFENLMSGREAVEDGFELDKGKCYKLAQYIYTDQTELNSWNVDDDEFENDYIDILKDTPHLDAYFIMIN